MSTKKTTKIEKKTVTGTDTIIETVETETKELPILKPGDRVRITDENAHFCDGLGIPSYVFSGELKVERINENTTITLCMNGKTVGTMLPKYVELAE